MIKKLQKRFIGITMGLISVVLIMTFASMVLASANRMEQDSYRILSEEMARQRIFINNPQTEIPTKEPGASDSLQKPFDRQPPFSTFFVLLDDDANVTELFDRYDQITMELAQEAVTSALAKGQDSGTLSALSLRYIINTSPNDEIALGFIDNSYETEFINQQILQFTLIGAASLLAFFLISLYLSRFATQPIEKAWKQQQQFIADASHELKTPITVILANTSILMAKSNVDETTNHKWISYIDLEAKRMKKLVEDLLFLARIDSTDHKLTHSSIALSDIIYENTLPFEALIFESGNTLTADIEPSLYIQGDSGQIKQLVSILLDNACKYASNKSSITVTLSQRNHQAILTVNNKGLPIPEDEVTHIFDRFYRIDKARGRDNNSYGLGLSIAHEIVRAHKGHINVNSTEQDGTTFTVTLPITK